MSDGTVTVRGYRELYRAFSLADAQLKRELRKTLRDAAEPVRADAETFAYRRIRNIREGDFWSEMRTGVTQRSVYVVPQPRGTRKRSRKRPNLADLLMDRAMQPALDRNEKKVVEKIDDLLADIERTWGRG